MRILFNLLDAGIGGGQRVALSVAGELSRRGHSLGVTVPAPGPATARFAELGARVHCIPIVSLSRPQNVLRAAACMRGYDLVYSHTSVPGAILGGASAAVARRPHAVHQHIYPHFALQPGRRTVQRRLFAAAVRRAAAVIAVADHVADDLVAAGVPRGRIAVIPNAVPLPALEPDYSPGSGLPRIGLLGRLDPQKGADVFIEAARIAGRGTASYRIGVPGEIGPGYADDVRRAAKEAEVELVAVGGAGEEFLRGLDVVAMPSRYEGSPLVLLEAMGLGKPVVASAIPGVREVVVEGAGILVPAGDAHALAGALATLAADPDRRRSLGARAREVAERDHPFDAWVERVLDIVETAAVSWRRPRR